MSLKRKSAAAVLWNVLTSGFGQFFSFVVFILLARLMSVEEFGLVGFAFLIVEFVSIFLSIGVSQNLIRRDEWTDEFASTYHSIILLVAAGIALLLAAAVAPIVYFSYSEKLAYILAALAFIPILDSLRTTHFAKMQREFHNKRLAYIRLTSTTFGGCVSIALAFFEFGAWSLVIGRFSQSIFATFATNFVSDFKAKFHIEKTHIKEIVEFGKPLLYMALLGFLSGKTVNMLVGVFFGASAFALLSMARRAPQILIELIINPLNKSLVATLSRLEGEQRVSALYRVLRIACFVILPAYLGLGAVSEPFILLFVGENWIDSAFLMSIASVSAPGLIVGYFLPMLMVSSGMPRTALHIKITTLVASISAPVIAIPLGIEGMVAAMVFVTYLTLPIRFHIASRKVDISLGGALKSVYPFIISSLLMFASVKYLYSLDINMMDSHLIELTAGVLLGAVVYLTILSIFFNRHLFTVVNEIKNLRK
ncbi:oligosaccharide flippase family protein [Neiella sp. HB171785]|uniref:Oligosaccharide flippase family protein n=1 Tax=Neiella litorisoli TaxID=2771431 RepID=A0A8J6QLX8_9GAMM|nr:oligosaccharide flippase family protein [Neiella litorisoli]MBD1390551.1 oligosaccharide flippase family protein [Neiella litorisoli]